MCEEKKTPHTHVSLHKLYQLNQLKENIETESRKRFQFPPSSRERVFSPGLHVSSNKTPRWELVTPHSQVHEETLGHLSSWKRVTSGNYCAGT